MAQLFKMQCGGSNKIKRYILIFVIYVYFKVNWIFFKKIQIYHYTWNPAHSLIRIHLYLEAFSYSVTRMMTVTHLLGCYIMRATASHLEKWLDSCLLVALLRILEGTARYTGQLLAPAEPWHYIFTHVLHFKGHFCAQEQHK